jgi:hypothetical protein
VQTCRLPCFPSSLPLRSTANQQAVLAAHLIGALQRIRGALSASEPTRDTRQSRTALVDTTELAGLVLPGGNTRPWVAGEGQHSRGDKSHGRENQGGEEGEQGGEPAASWVHDSGGTWRRAEGPRAAALGSGLGGGTRRGGAEDEALTRFRAFVRSSGLEDLLEAGDGRVWDAARSCRDAPKVGTRGHCTQREGGTSSAGCPTCSVLLTVAPCRSVVVLGPVAIPSPALQITVTD